MAAPAPKFAWLRTFLVIVVVLVVPFTLYYFLYATNQGANAERRGYRALARVASEMQRQTELRAIVLATAAWSGKVTSIDPALKQSNLLEPETPKKDTPAPVEGQISSAIWVEDAPEPRFRIDLRFGSRTPDAAASTSLRDLVDISLMGSEFDGLLIRRKSPTPSPSDDLLPFIDSLPTDVATAIRKHEVTMCAPSTKESTDTSTLPTRGLALIEVPSVKIGRAEYNTFCFPVTLQAPARIALGDAVRTHTDTPLQLELIGLVESSRLRKKALQLSATTFGMVGICAAAAFLLLPYLKIRFMARRERMRAIDIWLLSATALLGTALVTLAILHLCGHERLQAEVDARMQDLGRRMQETAKQEVTLIGEQLEHGGTALATGGGCTEGHRDGIGGFLTSTRLPETELSYPDFEALFCTDSSGQQVHKWMPRRKATDMVTTRDYPYFGKTMDLPENAEFNFEFDVIGAKTTGLQLAVFATPLDARSGHIGKDIPRVERTGVVVLATPLRSLMAAEVPKPYQYVVIGQNDKLLFGSPGAPTSSSDFFADVEPVATLQQVLRDTGTAGSPPGDWRYRGRMHRVQAFHLQNLPATLLIFYDKTLIEGLSGEVLVTSAFWIILLAAACGLAVGVARGLSARALDWLWPTARNWRLYATGALGFLVFAVGLVVVSTRLPVWLRALTIVVGPAVAALALPLLPRSIKHAVGVRETAEIENHMAQAWRRWLHPTLYLGFAVVALLALAAVPTALIFDDAFRAYHAAFQRLSAVDYRERVQSQRAQEAQRFAPESVDCTQHPKAEDCRPDRVPISAERYTRLKTLAAKLTDYARSPNASAAAAESSSSCRALFSFSFGPTRPQRYFSTLAAAWLPGSSEWNPRLHASLCAVDASTIGPLGPALHPLSLRSSTAIGALVLLLFVLWFFVRSVATHILGLAFEGDGVLDRSQDPLAGGRWLLLRPTATAMKALRQKFDKLTVLDLADSRYDAASFPKKLDDPAAVIPPEAPLLLLNGEAHLAVEEWRKAILKCITGPPYRDTLFLATAIDPLHFLAAQLAETADATRQAALAGEVQQWAQALTTVNKARYPRPERPPLIVRDDPRRSAHIVERLEAECQSDDVLNAIKAHLLSRDDFWQLDWNDIVERVQDLAEPHYQKLWGLCSVEEKLTMIQLAEEGVVNPRAFDVLRRLRRRRLVRVEPRFCLMNESFRRFVVEAETPAQVRDWETPDVGQSWARVRVPLLTLLFVLTAVLFYAQQPFFNSTVALVAGAAGAVSSVTGLFAKARQALSPGGKA